MEQSPLVNCFLPKKDMLDDIDGSLVLDKGMSIGVGVHGYRERWFYKKNIPEIGPECLEVC